MGWRKVTAIGLLLLREKKVGRIISALCIRHPFFSSHSLTRKLLLDNQEGKVKKLKEKKKINERHLQFRLSRRNSNSNIEVMHVLPP